MVNVTEVTVDVRVEPRTTSASDPTINLTGFGASTAMVWDTTSFDLEYPYWSSSDNAYWNRCRASVDSTSSRFLLGLNEAGGEPFTVESITLRYTEVGNDTNA